MKTLFEGIMKLVKFVIVVVAVLLVIFCWKYFADKKEARKDDKDWTYLMTEQDTQEQATEKVTTEATTQVMTEVTIEMTTETTTETTTEMTTEMTTESSTVSPDFKKTMDEYEAFFDSYVDFMKSYDMNDPTMMTKYADFMSEYATTMSDLEKIDEESLSTADYAYYAEVMARINSKLLTVTY